MFFSLYLIVGSPFLLLNFCFVTKLSKLIRRIFRLSAIISGSHAFIIIFITNYETLIMVFVFLFDYFLLLLMKLDKERNKDKDKMLMLSYILTRNAYFLVLWKWEKKSNFAKSMTQIWHSQQSLTRKQWTISIVVVVGLQNMLSSVWCCCDKTYVLKKKNIQEMLYIFFLLKWIMIIFNDNSLNSKPISLSRAHECKHFEYLMWH